MITLTLVWAISTCIFCYYFTAMGTIIHKIYINIFLDLFDT
jgi:hypothetical protein